MKKFGLIAGLMALSACAGGEFEINPVFSSKSPATEAVMRWDAVPASDGWTEATVAAIDNHGGNLEHGVG